MKYPGIKEAEEQKKVKRPVLDDEPDWIGDAPNYDKFKGWSVDKVLSWLNID